MKDLKKFEVWFVTGSQHLYGAETLKQVDQHSAIIAKELNQNSDIPVSVVFKPVVTTPDAITQICVEANQAKNCVGIITWMHTFSPAKMWIAGLTSLQKPFVHLHTQFNRDIPWSEIDMDFMNLNQSAHGGREFGFIGSRLRLNRKVVVGHWQDKQVQERLAIWSRVACGWNEMRNMKVARFGDNMREVAVTEGDKVAAQIKFGMAVNGYGLGDLTAFVDAVSDQQINSMIEQYQAEYQIVASLLPGGASHSSLRDSAKIEIGMRAFLQDGGFKAFTTTFENLYGLKQLPGMAVQRLMRDGYGFGGEGDWKTAALVRAMKVMDVGLPGGSSFMEDYTYHLSPGNMKVLGSHMLEVCESIAAGPISLETHPLSIGGKADPIRTVFNVAPGLGINASVMDMGNRFRMVVNDVNIVAADEDLPKLPVARVVWEPKPDLPTAAAAWIYAGGAHHTAFSQVLTAEYMEDFAEMADIEYLRIGKDTTISEFKKELRWNDMYYCLAKGL